jgi:WD40 repeat protein
MHFDGSLVAACCADDGSAYAAVGNQGEVCWLAPDFTIRWRRTLADPAVALAMDPFGLFLAVSDAHANVHLFNRQGHSTARLGTARPLHHLAFVPTADAVVGCADYGLVTSFDLSGSVRWRDGLVAHAGSLSVSGDGGKILIACFSEGLQSYDLQGHKLGRLSAQEACRLVSVDFAGQHILAAGLSNRILLLDSNGRTSGTQEMAQAVVGVALGPLGDYAMVALAQGPVIRLELANR